MLISELRGSAEYLGGRPVRGAPMEPDTSATKLINMSGSTIVLKSKSHTVRREMRDSYNNHNDGRKCHVDVTNVTVDSVVSPSMRLDLARLPRTWRLNLHFPI